MKTSFNINFQKGVDSKSDPFQVPAGKFLRLVNTVFDKVGRLTKRNGFIRLLVNPLVSSYLTTFNGDLQAIGNDLRALSPGTNMWVGRGSIYPTSVSTLPIIRNAVNQTYADSAIAPNALICTAYAEKSTSTTTVYKYVIADSVTGQNVRPPTDLPSANATYGTPRVYVLGNYFVILYTVDSGGFNLVYLAIPWTNTNAIPVTATLVTDMATAVTTGFDAAILNNTMYIAYCPSLGAVEMKTLTHLLVLGTSVVLDPDHTPNIFSVAVDTDNQLVWATYYDGGTQDGYTVAVNAGLIIQLAPTQVITSEDVLNLTSTAQSSMVKFWYEIDHDYSYDTVPSHYIKRNQCNLIPLVGTPVVAIRSVGLASKAFIMNGISYFLAAYQSDYQPTYFLVDGDASDEDAPTVVAKLAYQNGGGYVTRALANCSVDGFTVAIPYLFKDLIQAVNKGTALPTGTPVNGVYAQTGINLGTFTFTTDSVASVEIGKNLNLTGGFLWMYDGYLPVEQNFFLYPDSIKATWSDMGGAIVAKPDGATNANAYAYQVVYEWADNQGNIFRSAPSIPKYVTTTGAGSSGTITLDIPTLRLTYKTANPVKITVFRWSIAKPIYYQSTAIIFQTTNSLLLNSLTVDSVQFVDKLADASIVGNSIIYTNGGTVEDINAPASDVLALFDDRLWLVDAEDRNLLWFSKQVIEATPVEMSDLFTFFVAPSTGAQGSTGFITALYPMDDKLIIFKANAIYYITGRGPDNTGANNQYSEPIFITSAVGCSNPRSIVLTPNGLMFQSAKGIWLLGRGLDTKYIGAPVEEFNNIPVTSAVAIPKTNQVRFTLANQSPTQVNHLMYDYYVDQWGEFAGAPARSSTLYQDMHTIVDYAGVISQERAGHYSDDGRPVLLSFITSWLSLASLQGYERFYWFYFLGEYLSPHKIQIGLAYDFNSAIVQQQLVTPNNFSSAVPSPYGDQPAPFGSPVSAPLTPRKVYAKYQKCESFQITMQELFDPSMGVPAGAGFTLSGLNLSVLSKRPTRPLAARNTVG